MRHAVDDLFLIGRDRKFWGGDVGKAGSAVEATGRDRADGASEGRPVEGVGARLELRRALLGLAGRRVLISLRGRGRRRRLGQCFGVRAVDGREGLREARVARLVVLRVRVVGTSTAFCLLLVP